MLRSMKTFAMTLALVLATACESGTTGPEIDPSSATDEFAAFDTGVTFDAASVDRGTPHGWDKLAAEIPGFAGYFIDRACNVNVLLVDLAHAEKAKQLLTPVLRRLLEVRRCPDTATILVHPADYSWLQLKDFLARLRPLQQVRGVNRMGILVSINRIVIVLESRTLHDRVVEQVQALDVPLGAVIIRVSSGTTGRTG